MPAVPKPERAPRGKRRTWVSKQTRTRKQTESAIIKVVRPQVVARDGYCRFAGVRILGPCNGVSEWAHWGDSRRSKTMKKPPDERHTTAGTLMQCEAHHDLYDQHMFDLEALDATAGANGRLRIIIRGQVVYEEP